MLSETISEKVNIEEFFGVSAGKVWQCLNDRGEMDLNDIARCTSLSVNGGLEMPNYGGIEVLKPINTCLFFS